MLFMIKLHYGGTFSNEQRVYENGYVKWVHNCDSNTFSYFELTAFIVNDLKYRNVQKMYYVKPGETIRDGVHKLYSMEDVNEMCRLATMNNNEIEIYVEHWVDTPLTVETERCGEEGDENEDSDEANENEDSDEEDDGEESDSSQVSKDIEDGIEGKKRKRDKDESMLAYVFEEEQESDIEIDLDDLENESDDKLREIRMKKLDIKKGKTKVLSSSPTNESQQNASTNETQPEVPHTSQPQKTQQRGGTSRLFTDEEMADVENDMMAENSDEYPQDIAEDRDDGDSIESKEVKIFNPKTDMGNIHLFIGLQFATADDFRRAVRKFGLDNRIDVKFVRNEGRRLEVACYNSRACPWRMWVSKLGYEKTFAIKTFNNVHKCGKAVTVRQLNARYLAGKYATRILKNPYWKLRDMKEEISSTFEMDVSIGVCARAKKKALLNAIGSMKEHYGKLWDYRKEIKNKNKGSTVEIGYLEPTSKRRPIFQRMYICLNGLKQGLKAGCRQVIGLDGCFLKGVMRGQLLVAVGRDPNNQMYPVAWGVVQIENFDNWAWFISLLCKDLDMEVGLGWTLISDQQKGLVAAIKELLPLAEHRNCARHIYSNWCKDFRGLEYKFLFWNIANSTNMSIYEKACKELIDCDKDAHTELMKRKPELWSKVYFAVDTKCDSCENNMTEAFNGSILDERGMPIIHLFEELRKKTMVRIQKRKEWMESHWDTLCPRIRKKIEARTIGCRRWTATYGGNAKYQVDKDKEGYCVDLATKTCTCREFDLSGIPCTHALCCIYMRGLPVEDYVESCYTKETFLKVYSHVLEPIGGEDNWEKTLKQPLLPPGYKKMTGRPRKKRKRQPHEEVKRQGTQEIVGKGGTKIHCRICFGEGHNARTCPKKNEENLPKPQPKKSKKANIGASTSGTTEKGTKQRVYNKDRNHGTKKKVNSDAPPKRRGRPPRRALGIKDPMAGCAGVIHDPITGETYYRNPGGFKTVHVETVVNSSSFLSPSAATGNQSQISQSSPGLVSAATLTDVRGSQRYPPGKSSGGPSIAKPFIPFSATRVAAQFHGQGTQATQTQATQSQASQANTC